MPYRPPATLSSELPVLVSDLRDIAPWFGRECEILRHVTALVTSARTPRQLLESIPRCQEAVTALRDQLAVCSKILTEMEVRSKKMSSDELF